MNEENEARIKGKLNFFLEEKIPVHVSRKDKQFWNGELVEKKSDDVFVMSEREFGLVHLFICDIFEVNEYRGEWK